MITPVVDDHDGVSAQSGAEVGGQVVEMESAEESEIVHCSDETPATETIESIVEISETAEFISQILQASGVTAPGTTLDSAGSVSRPIVHIASVSHDVQARVNDLRRAEELNATNAAVAEVTELAEYVID